MLVCSSGLFSPQAHYTQPWSGELIILAPGQIPSVDFYLTSRFLYASVKRTIIYDSTTAIVPTVPSDGAFVVIVRHSALAWFDYLKLHASKWSGVAYLMDDDLPGAWQSADIPWDYRVWTTCRYWLIRQHLSAVCDRIWLSTSALQARYANNATTLLPPLPYGRQAATTTSQLLRWGYHGTRVHYHELAWLVPIVHEVQRIVPHAEFEVFGDQRVKRLFAKIPRVKVMPPMPWQDYVKYSQESQLILGLAPMLPGRFNDVRSHTKAFDIARCGAAGLFSDAKPYANLKAALPAYIIPNEPQVWIDRIVGLLNDAALSKQAANNLVGWVQQQLAADALDRLLEQLIMRR